MKVWIVSNQDYEQYDILGIYSDKEKALEEYIIATRELCLQKQKMWSSRYDFEPNYSESIQLDEYEVIE